MHHNRQSDTVITDYQYQEENREIVRFLVATLDGHDMATIRPLNGKYAVALMP